MMNTTPPWVAAMAACMLGACWTPVATELSQEQARKVTLELQVAGIPAQMKGGAGQWTIRVPDLSVPAAHALLVHLVAEPTAESGWFAEPDAYSLHEEDRERERLLGLLEALPGVVRADVITGLPDQLTATVVVHAGHAWHPATEEHIRTIVRSRWPFEVEVTVVVLALPAVPAVPVQQVGPWNVVSGSASSFRAALLGLGALALLQAGLLAWQLRRRSAVATSSTSTAPSSPEA
jgi:acyl-coenzyme A synthetase/AMP-(fatty) acid ligase